MSHGAEAEGLRECSLEELAAVLADALMVALASVAVSAAVAAAAAG